MAPVLVSGGPGSGKSSVAAELRLRGVESIDADYGLARWEDQQGRPVTMPASPRTAWLRRHRWQWVGERLEPVLRDRPTVICGAAYNMADYLPRFELLILLRIDPATMVRRLADPGRNNDWGRAGDTLAWSFGLCRRQEAELRAAGARGVDARQPVEYVVDEIVRIGRGCGMELFNR